jgi:peptidyl-Lys metalloendopeptidase
MYQFLFILLGCVICNSQELTASIRLVEDATVVLELSNTAPYGVALLRWNLPLDDRFGSDTFRVVYEGKLVEYIGPRVKYAVPDINDYVFFSPNETKEYTIRLENSYDFTRSGDYDVVFMADVMDYETDTAFHNLPHKTFVPFSGVISNGLTFSTTKSLHQKIVIERACTASERNQINAGNSAHTTMINHAYTAIGSGNTAHYREWFGAFVASRHSAVRDIIGWTRGNTRIAFECDDRANVYAYVYPTDTSHTIYVCDAFWPAPTTGGFDTKAGTIIHELSHFNDIGATNDWVYGTAAARNLASTNPARAIANADNYEYFCESSV